jgi:hypothetical protein
LFEQTAPQSTLAHRNCPAYPHPASSSPASIQSYTTRGRSPAPPPLFSSAQTERPPSLLARCSLPAVNEQGIWYRRKRSCTPNRNRKCQPKGVYHTERSDYTHNATCTLENTKTALFHNRLDTTMPLLTKKPLERRETRLLQQTTRGRGIIIIKRSLSAGRRKISSLLGL